QTERIGDIGEHLGIGVEVIAELGGVRRVTVTEARPVEGDRMPAISQSRHQSPKLEGRARISVRQKQHRSILRTGLPHEQFASANPRVSMNCGVLLHGTDLSNREWAKRIWMLPVP